MGPVEITIDSESVEQTRSVGRRIGELLESGLCIGLFGPLGSGKTQFVKGLAAGLGVPESVTVNSPTFVVINEYSGRRHVYHIDAYRLSGADEAASLGFDEMIGSGGVVVVEWAERVAGLLPEDHLSIHFDHSGESRRRIAVSGSGTVSKSVVDLLAMSS